MPSPRNILDQRLASGEITATTHEKLLKKLEKGSSLTPPPLSEQPINSPMPPPINSSRVSAKWPWIVGGIAAVFGVLILAGLATVEGLNIGNLSAEGQMIVFKLANTSSKFGDVLIIVEQDEFEKCESVIAVNPNQVYDIRLGCPTLRNGRFTVTPLWAEYDQEKAAVAKRIYFN